MGLRDIWDFTRSDKAKNFVAEWAAAASDLDDGTSGGVAKLREANRERARKQRLTDQLMDGGYGASDASPGDTFKLLSPPPPPPRRATAPAIQNAAMAAQVGGFNVGHAPLSYNTPAATGGTAAQGNAVLNAISKINPGVPTAPAQAPAALTTPSILSPITPPTPRTAVVGGGNPVPPHIQKTIRQRLASGEDVDEISKWANLEQYKTAKEAAEKVWFHSPKPGEVGGYYRKGEQPPGYTPTQPRAPRGYKTWHNPVTGEQAEYIEGAPHPGPDWNLGKTPVGQTQTDRWNNTLNSALVDLDNGVLAFDPRRNADIRAAYRFARNELTKSAINPTTGVVQSITPPTPHWTRLVESLPTGPGVQPQVAPPEVAPPQATISMNAGAPGVGGVSPITDSTGKLQPDPMSQAASVLGAVNRRPEAPLVTTAPVPTSESTRPTEADEAEARLNTIRAAVEASSEETGYDVNLFKTTALPGLAYQGVNRIADAFSLGLPSPEASRSAADLRALGAVTLLTLAEDVTGRPNLFTLETLQGVIPQPSTFFTGKETSLNQARALLTMFDDKINANQVIQNRGYAGGYSKKVTTDAQTQSDELRALRDHWKTIIRANTDGGTKGDSIEAIKARHRK